MPPYCPICRSIAIASTCVIALNLSQPAQAGFLGHVAAYATGAVAAHEAEHYLDRRRESSPPDARQPGDAPDIEHDGRMGLVFPEAVPRSRCPA